MHLVRFQAGSAMQRKIHFTRSELTWAKVRLEAMGSDFDLRDNPEREDALQQAERRLDQVDELWVEANQIDSDYQIYACYLEVQSSFEDIFGLLMEWMKQIDRMRMDG